MTVETFAASVGQELRFEGPDFQEAVRVILNRVIKDFLQYSEWNKCQFSDTIAIDGTGYYALSGLDPDYEHIIAVFVGTQKYVQVTYENYLSFDDPTGIFAIHGEYIYIPGDTGTMNVLYSSAGSGYPSAKISDDLSICDKYFSVLSAWVKEEYLFNIGWPTAMEYKNRRIEAMAAVRQAEARQRNSNQLVHFRRD